MDPATFLRDIVDPGLAFLHDTASVPVTDQARVLVLAIAGQESNWRYRLQQGGPARSFWQFEEGGGVAGVLSHPASKPKIESVCEALKVPFNVHTVYIDMADNDKLACSMARLLLWTDPHALPALGDGDGAWSYYQRNWRPGMPHPEAWPAKYAASLAALG